MSPTLRPETDEEIRAQVQQWRDWAIRNGCPEPQLVSVRPEIECGVYDNDDLGYLRHEREFDADRERDVPLADLLDPDSVHLGEDTPAVIAGQLREVRTVLTRAIRTLETDGVMTLDAEAAIVAVEDAWMYEGATAAVRWAVERHWKQYREDRKQAKARARERWREEAMAEVMTDEWFAGHVKRLQDLRAGGYYNVATIRSAGDEVPS